MATKEESIKKRMDSYDLEWKFRYAIQKISAVAEALHDGGAHDAGGHYEDYYFDNSLILRDVYDDLKEVVEALEGKF